MKLNFLKVLKENFGLKVFVTFTLLIFIISFSFTFFFIGYQSDYLRDTLIKKGQLLAEILAYNSRLGVFSENEEMLKIPVEGIFQQEGVLEVSVFNLERQLLTRRERSKPGISENSVEGRRVGRHKIFEILMILMESSCSYYLEGNSKAEFWSPVISSSSYSEDDVSLFLEGALFEKRERIIGFVGITVDKGMLKKQLHNLLIKSILIWIAFLVIGSGVTYFITKGVTRPLNKLTEGVKTIEKGGIAKEVNIKTKDEIGRLARAFNDMFKSLSKRERELQESEESYRELTNSITDVFFAMDANVRYTYWNKASEKLTGIPAKDAIGKSLFEIFPDTPQTRAAGETYREVLKTRASKTFINEYSLKGKRYFFDITAYPSRDGLSVFVRDITKQKEMERSLWESENRFRELFNNMSSGVAVYEPVNNGSDFIIKDYNRAGELISKVNKDHIVGRSIQEVFPGIQKFGLFEVLQRVWNSGAPEHQPVSLYHDDYLTHWAENYVYKLPSGEIVAVFDDVTKRVQAEEELKRSQGQLRSLAHHLQSVRENERTAVAREIHDELGQVLTGLKMDLSWMAKKIPEDQTQLLDKIHSMSELTRTTLRTVQRISTELRPGLLDDLGLVAAIEWQAEEFENRTGIKCSLTLEGEHITLDEKRATALFRVFQETLTNVARHAQATRVSVSLKEKDGDLKLRVRDNGTGITKEQISDPKSFGLIGIKERVFSWGGKVTISGRPGKGTTVVARMPIKD